MFPMDETINLLNCVRISYYHELLLYLPKVKEMMSDIIEAFKDNAQIETWLSGKSRKAVELKVIV